MVELVTSAAPADDAATLLSRWLTDVHEARGGARLGIAGGSAAAAFARLQAKLPARVWRALKLTWVDERVVPVSSDDSNRGALERAGALSRPPGLVLPLVLDGEDGAAACARFSKAFADQFGGALDVALLGMGEDGHVASLFPGHRLLGATTTVAHLEDSPKPPRARVTLTLPVLSREGLRRLVLAAGAGKRAALKRLAAHDVSVPVSRLGSLTVMTDQPLDLMEKT
ncbi:MAG: 6-phosphogluconolactonase [Myxococcus sp.]|nr:6-phosphogluconolactonase [Myxococcus sp.]